MALSFQILEFFRVFSALSFEDFVQKKPVLHLKQNLPYRVRPNSLKIPLAEIRLKHVLGESWVKKGEGQK